MNLIELLEACENEILDEATRGLIRAHLKHYGANNANEDERRLRVLYQLILQSVKGKNLGPVIDYVQIIAQERFATGYDLHEVQVAFNVLEEAIWRRIVQGLPPSELAEALGLVSTVHGAAKDALARTYVSLACQRKTPSLNLRVLFEGLDDL
jgi:hypothetical protein